MLSRNAKKVLRLAKRKPDKSVDYAAIMKTLGMDHGSAVSACHQLISAGFAEETVSHPLPGSAVPSGIFLTEEGRNSRKTKLYSVLDRLIFSVIVPIIVAIVTTLITLWLEGVIQSIP